MRYFGDIFGDILGGGRGGSRGGGRRDQRAGWGRRAAHGEDLQINLKTTLKSIWL
ncbi:MAG: hypothetical protein U0T83_04990 [Bacteriovoracaceae bacterium]